RAQRGSGPGAPRAGRRILRRLRRRSLGDSAVEQLTEPDALLAESPLWDATGHRLLWVDIERGDVHSLHLETRRRELWQIGTMVGSVRPARDGRLVLGLQDGVD